MLYSVVTGRSFFYPTAAIGESGMVIAVPVLDAQRSVSGFEAMISRDRGETFTPSSSQN